MNTSKIKVSGFADTIKVDLFSVSLTIGQFFLQIPSFYPNICYKNREIMFNNPSHMVI